MVSKVWNTIIISLLMAMSLFAFPVFNKSEKILSYWEAVIVLMLLDGITVFVANSNIEKTKKKLENARNKLSESALTIAFAIGIWMSYAFGYMTIDYLGDMRAIFVSAILYAYVFVWMGASIVAFVSGHK